MPIPQPRDGDARGIAPDGPAQPRAKPGASTQNEWSPVPGRPGFFHDRHGRLKYDPFCDPSHPLYNPAS